METKAYVFFNEYDSNAQYGWVYIFDPEVCGETEIGVEVIDLDAYNRYQIFNNKDLLKGCRTIIEKRYLALMPQDLFDRYEKCMCSREDKSDEMLNITNEVIDAAMVMDSLTGVSLRIVDNLFVSIKDNESPTEESVSRFLEMLIALDDEVEASLRARFMLRNPYVKNVMLRTNAWIRFASKHRKFIVGEPYINNERFKRLSDAFEKKYNVMSIEESIEAEKKHDWNVV